ncbi:MAG: DNA-3-methyladenine glycosylase I [Methylococcales symbiont of Iophon sp. n. MRB-2018]|nr:MAG: DNA-3-methyladenine glycosylase I [Methylococcales symbiont of Iophon sp. n. MRB-2018]KAF3980066.1 MAG: DNA-3-methyladenine glycosylase I [Methylococcales symbiont of Iophon sp. n. MRB-2018]
MIKCKWGFSSPAMEYYHDEEWGVPVHDDLLLFEFLILEGTQAGLSWSTVLNKRQGYRQAFDQFDAQKIIQYNENRVQQLLKNSEIIRNKLKVNATITNAKAFLAIQQKHGSFNDYIWQFTQGKTIQNCWQTISDVPVSTQQSEDMSKQLKQDGFKFVGSTICYAYMQAVGIVNDHTVDCFRHAQIQSNLR